MAPIESPPEPDEEVLVPVVGVEVGSDPPTAPPVCWLVPLDPVATAMTEAGTTGDALFSAQY
jgi:hypothetical protein